MHHALRQAFVVILGGCLVLCSILQAHDLCKRIQMPSANASRRASPFLATSCAGSSPGTTGGGGASSWACTPPWSPSSSQASFSSWALALYLGELGRGKVVGWLGREPCKSCRKTELGHATRFGFSVFGPPCVKLDAFAMAAW